MDERRSGHGALRNTVPIVEVVVQCVGALDSYEGGVFAAATCVPVLTCGSNDTKPVGDGAEYREKSLQISKESARAPGRASEGIRRDDPRGSADTRLRDARKIDLAQIPRAEWTVPVSAREVVAENAVPDE